MDLAADDASASASVYGRGIIGIQRGISGSFQCCDKCGHVVLGPRPEHELVVSHLHGVIQPGNENARARRAFEGSAASYSPGRLPSEYHRR
jgi:hypothetical protein